MTRLEVLDRWHAKARCFHTSRAAAALWRKLKPHLTEQQITTLGTATSHFELGESARELDQEVGRVKIEWNRRPEHTELGQQLIKGLKEAVDHNRGEINLQTTELELTDDQRKEIIETIEKIPVGPGREDPPTLNLDEIEEVPAENLKKKQSAKGKKSSRKKMIKELGDPSTWEDLSKRLKKAQDKPFSDPTSKS